MCLSPFLVCCLWQLRSKFRCRGMAKQTKVRSKCARNPKSRWISIAPLTLSLASNVFIINELESSSLISNTNCSYYLQMVKTCSCWVEHSPLPLELTRAPFPSPALHYICEF